LRDVEESADRPSRELGEGRSIATPRPYDQVVSHPLRSLDSGSLRRVALEGGGDSDPFHLRRPETFIARRTG